MPTFVMLGHFSDQGIRNIKDTTKRAEAFKEQAKRLGGNVKELVWTISHDNDGLERRQDRQCT
jgi:uncharacterized protein with GYD domain